MLAASSLSGGAAACAMATALRAAGAASASCSAAAALGGTSAARGMHAEAAAAAGGRSKPHGDVKLTPRKAYTDRLMSQLFTQHNAVLFVQLNQKTHATRRTMRTRLDAFLAPAKKGNPPPAASGTLRQIKNARAQANMRRFLGDASVDADLTDHLFQAPTLGIALDLPTESPIVGVAAVNQLLSAHFGPGYVEDKGPAAKESMLLGALVQNKFYTPMQLAQLREFLLPGLPSTLDGILGMSTTAPVEGAALLAKNPYLDVHGEIMSVLQGTQLPTHEALTEAIGSTGANLVGTMAAVDAQRSAES